MSTVKAPNKPEITATNTQFTNSSIITAYYYNSPLKFAKHRCYTVFISTLIAADNSAKISKLNLYGKQLIF